MAKLAKAAGWFSVSDLARHIRRGRATLNYWLVRGVVPYPTTAWGGSLRKYYSREDVERICEFLRANKLI